MNAAAKFANYVNPKVGISRAFNSQSFVRRADIGANHTDGHSLNSRLLRRTGNRPVNVIWGTGDSAYGKRTQNQQCCGEQNDFSHLRSPFRFPSGCFLRCWQYVITKFFPVNRFRFGKIKTPGINRSFYRTDDYCPIGAAIFLFPSADQTAKITINIPTARYL